jgi:dsRNA-specific ribonuclease
VYKISINSDEYRKEAIDIEEYYEYSVKIFGDVFEALIAAIFIDSKSLETTWNIMYKLMKEHIQKYGTKESIKNHMRTELLE